MTIIIGADHRGFQLKNIITTYLQDKNIRVEDMGNYEHDPEDDFPDYATKVAQAVLQNKEYLGIVICGSGAGISIAANKHAGIYCTIGFSVDQIIASRRDDHINVLALAADFTTEEDAKKIVDAYIATTVNTKEKYLRRINKIDSI
ncbi:ribose 5-phosphate isomerase B [soil metagenome]